MLQNATERLLGDAQDVQEIGDLQAWVAVDEMQHAVMRTSEAEGLELVIGVADEIAIGEKQQLDDVPAQARCGAGRSLAERVSFGFEPAPADGLDKIMSAILTYLGFNVTKQSIATK